MPTTEPTSGNAGFDHWARTRFVREGLRVVMLPDSLPGKFSVGMTPEQAEHLAARLVALAIEARAARAAKYPEDAK